MTGIVANNTTGLDIPQSASMIRRTYSEENINLLQLTRFLLSQEKQQSQTYLYRIIQWIIQWIIQKKKSKTYLMTNETSNILLGISIP